jgi:hypothetical protein
LWDAQKNTGPRITGWTPIPSCPLVSCVTLRKQVPFPVSCLYNYGRGEELTQLLKCSRH